MANKKGRDIVYWDTKKGEAGVALNAAAVSEADLVPGLDYKYYEGAWSKLPDFEESKPAKSGDVEDFDISNRNWKDNFGFVFSGHLKIEKDGDYYLATTSDDGSALSLAGTEVVNNDGTHAMISKNTPPLSLKAGFYPLEVKFFDQIYGEGLSVTMYGGKGGGWKRIPRNMLFRKK